MSNIMTNETIAARLGLRGAQAAVLDHIEAQGGRLHQTAGDIGKAIGFSMASANQALHRLRGQHLIRIDGYRQVRSPGKPVAVYRLNAPVIAALLGEETGAPGHDPTEAHGQDWLNRISSVAPTA